MAVEVYGNLYVGSDKDYAIAARQKGWVFVSPTQVSFINPILFGGALSLIENGLKNGHKVLVYHNEGEGLAPSVVLVYLAKHLNLWGDCTLMEAVDCFMQVYPFYRPGRNLITHLQKHWDEY